MIPNDPAMLLSFMNMKLRDYGKNLEEICEDLDIDAQEIEEKLSAIGCRYDRKQNRFV